MYITINNVIGKERIDLSYPIHSFNTRKEVAVISMHSDNVQYEIIKAHMEHYDSPTINGKLILSKIYTGRELLSIAGGMVKLNQFVDDDQVIKMSKLKGITEMILNLDELDNTDNLEDGRPSNALLTYHVTDDKDFMSFEPNIPQYKRLENGEFTSLTLRITDQENNIINDGPQVTVVLHICDCKI